MCIPRAITGADYVQLTVELTGLSRTQFQTESVVSGCKDVVATMSSSGALVVLPGDIVIVSVDAMSSAGGSRRLQSTPTGSVVTFAIFTSRGSEVLRMLRYGIDAACCGASRALSLFVVPLCAPCVLLELARRPYL
jgi:hypothetical protein